MLTTDGNKVHVQVQVQVLQKYIPNLKIFSGKSRSWVPGVDVTGAGSIN